MADASQSNDGILTNKAFLMSVWAFFFIIFACAPICVNRYRRELWWKRVTSCRWTVDVEPEPEPEWHRVMRQRYEAYQARITALSLEGGEQLTMEEEDEIRQLFLLERMSGFTYSLNDADIRHKLDNSTDRSQNLEGSTHSLHATQEVTSGNEKRVQVTTLEESDFLPNVVTDVNPAVDSPDEEMGMVDMHVMEESDSIVRVPIEGQPFVSGGATRWIQNGCAICLAGFESGDRVVWSATVGDPHVFHEDCMTKYFLAVGSKASRLRRTSLQTDPVNIQNPVEAATDFPMLCPSCRQQYISKPTISPTGDEESERKAEDQEAQDERVVISASSIQRDTTVDTPPR